MSETLSMSQLEALQFIRRVILKHKVRQFALNEIAIKFNVDQLQAKIIYFAAVYGCNSATVWRLAQYSKETAVNWAEARESLNLIKGL